MTILGFTWGCIEIPHRERSRILALNGALCLLAAVIVNEDHTVQQFALWTLCSCHSRVAFHLGNQRIERDRLEHLVCS